MCISLEKNIWKIIFGQGKVRENCRGPSAATLPFDFGFTHLYLISACFSDLDRKTLLLDFSKNLLFETLVFYT